MQMQPWLALALARDAQRRDIEQAARERSVRMSTPSIRQVVGRRIVTIGARIAAEPSLELARSR